MVDYIFGGGDSDGLLGIATLMGVTERPFYSFTSARSLPRAISEHVTAKEGKICIVDIGLDQELYPTLIRTLKTKPGFKTFYFDQHNLPSNITQKELPFTHSSIDPDVCSCENAYVATKSKLDPLIPAIASINDYIFDSPLVRKANELYGQDTVLYQARLLKFGLAYNMKDNKTKREFVMGFANGKKPSEITELVQRAEQGLIKYAQLQRDVQSRTNSTEFCSFAELPNTKGGYGNMLAGHTAQIGKTPIGALLLETDQETQKYNIICNDKKLNIGLIVREVASKIGGSGGGSESSAGAVLNTGVKDFFFKLLSDRVREEYAAVSIKTEEETIARMLADNPVPYLDCHVHTLGGTAGADNRRTIIINTTKTDERELSFPIEPNIPEIFVPTNSLSRKISDLNLDKGLELLNVRQERFLQHLRNSETIKREVKEDVSKMDFFVDRTVDDCFELPLSPYTIFQTANGKTLITNHRTGKVYPPNTEHDNLFELVAQRGDAPATINLTRETMMLDHLESKYGLQPVYLHNINSGYPDIASFNQNGDITHLANTGRYDSWNKIGLKLGRLTRSGFSFEPKVSFSMDVEGVNITNFHLNKASNPIEPESPNTMKIQTKSGESLFRFIGEGLMH